MNILAAYLTPFSEIRNTKYRLNLEAEIFSVCRTNCDAVFAVLSILL